MYTYQNMIPINYQLWIFGPKIEELDKWSVTLNALQYKPQ